MHIDEEISQALNDVEHRDDVRIIYACESGSRAWGFPSADSDYDVRFIYVRRRDWYLSIDFERKRDVIERPISGVLDVNGWDITKALRLLRKSNPVLLEWLSSPIVYRDMPVVSGAIRALVPEYHSPTASLHHYYSMTRHQVNTYLVGETIKAKKYFYALRALLAVQWIEEGRGVVPMEFETLVDAMVRDAEMRAEIDRLLVRKRSGEEMRPEPRIPIISDFIEREMARLQTARHNFPRPEADSEGLDRLFRWSIETVWAGMPDSAIVF
jgi:uncharacterized protein